MTMILVLLLPLLPFLQVQSLCSVLQEGLQTPVWRRWIKWWRYQDTSLTILASWQRSMKNISSQRASTVFIVSVSSFRRVMATALLQVSTHTDSSVSCNKYIFFPNHRAAKHAFKSSRIIWLYELNKRCSNITQTDTTKTAQNLDSHYPERQSPDMTYPRLDLTPTCLNPDRA